MRSDRELPVLIPSVTGQRWSCHSCGDCCRSLVVHLFPGERSRLDAQGWEEKLGVAPYVRLGRQWALNKRDDGACVFLDARNLCRIHAESGESAKPIACRVFPFSLRRTERNWQASLRFDCPSASASRGDALHSQVQGLGAVSGALDDVLRVPPDRPKLPGGLVAREMEVNALLDCLTQWLGERGTSPLRRILGAARFTHTLSAARLKRVRYERFVELLDLLFGALASECAAPSEPPTKRQRAMLRQFAFACSEHLTLSDARGGIVRRWRKRMEQLRKARCFLTGAGIVPPLVGFAGEPSFAAVEAVQPADGTDGRAINELVNRYLLARIAGRTVFGAGYYGWPIVNGLAALWLSVAAAGWIARYLAASDARTLVNLNDTARAIGVVDRGATRLPSLGTFAERTRASYFFSDDGLARILHTFRLAEDAL